MKKILFITILLGTSLFTFTFAKEANKELVSIGKITTTGAGLSGYDSINGFGKIRGSRRLINEDFGYANKFFINKLSGEDLILTKTIIKEKNNSLKLLNKDLKSAISSSGIIDRDKFTTKYVEIYNTFKIQITPYLNPNKSAAFNKYINGRKTAIKEKIEYIKKRITKKEIKYKKKVEKRENIKKAKELKEKTEQIEKEKKMEKLIKIEKKENVKNANETKKVENKENVININETKKKENHKK